MWLRAVPIAITYSGLNGLITIINSAGYALHSFSMCVVLVKYLHYIIIITDKSIVDSVPQYYSETETSKLPDTLSHRNLVRYSEG